MSSPSPDPVIECLVQKLNGWRPSDSGSKVVPAEVQEELAAIRRRTLSDAERLAVACCLLRHAAQVGLTVSDVQRIFKSAKVRTADDVVWLWFLLEAAGTEDIRMLLKDEERESLLRFALMDTWPKRTVAGSGNSIAVAVATRVLGGLSCDARVGDPPGDNLRHALIQGALALGASAGDTRVVAGFEVCVPAHAVRAVSGPSPSALPALEKARNLANAEDPEWILKKCKQDLDAAERRVAHVEEAFANEEERTRKANKELASLQAEFDRLKETLSRRDQELDACTAVRSTLEGAVERAATLEARLEAADAARQRAVMEARDAVAQARSQAERHTLTKCMQLASAPLSELERLGEMLGEDARNVVAGCLSQLKLAMRQPGDQ